MELERVRTPTRDCAKHKHYLPQPFGKGILVRSTIFMAVFALISLMLLIFGAIGPWTFGSNIFTSLSLVIIGVIGCVFSITLIFLTPHIHKHYQLFEFWAICIGFLRLTSTAALFLGTICILQTYIELRWFIKGGYYVRDQMLNERWIKIYEEMPDYQLMTERDSVYPNSTKLFIRGIAACVASPILFILVKIFQVGHKQQEKDRVRGYTVFTRYVFIAYTLIMDLTYYPVYGSIDQSHADINRVFYIVTLSVAIVAVVLVMIMFIFIIVFLATNTVSKAANHLLTKDQLQQMELEGGRKEQIKTYMHYMSQYTLAYRVLKAIPIVLWLSILLSATCQFILDAAANYSSTDVYKEIDNDVASFLTNWELAGLSALKGKELAQPVVCMNVYWSAIIFGVTVIFFLYETFRYATNAARFLKSYTLPSDPPAISPTNSRSSTRNTPNSRSGRTNQIINVTNIYPSYVVQTVNPLNQNERQSGINPVAFEQQEMNEDLRAPSRLHGENEYHTNADSPGGEGERRAEHVVSDPTIQHQTEWSRNPLSTAAAFPKEVIR
ncbi:hypothetical protein BLNAU_4703 [Blattamonas nauphoetae]|uniref:Transmembrane protein n=1 Tax=Blattamonas nauphoetae TaxID=2049346 RepID=A0ABQ9Y9X1_9EUKA|nr:hypothetical protein BLNAU_4703 [Blattamonas nauphoetae]